MAIGWLTPECRWRQRSHDRGISTVEEIWNMISERKKRVSHQVMKSEWAGSVEVSELYCDSLSKESVVQRDVREGVEGNVRAEVRGVRDARWNRVSPDIYPPFKGVVSQHSERWRRAKWDGVKDYSSDVRVLLGVSGGSLLPVLGHGCYPKVSMSYVLFRWWVVHISIPGFCTFHEVNNNLMTSSVLSWLPASHCRFHTHSDIPWSTFCILPFCHFKQPRFPPECHFKVWKC